MKTLRAAEGTNCFVFKEPFSEVCGNSGKKSHCILNLQKWEPFLYIQNLLHMTNVT